MPSPSKQARPVRTRPVRRGLVALNAALLVMLAGVTLAPEAGAQAVQPNRARGEYVMVGGDFGGSNSNAIFILDSANREMLTVLWDDSRGQIEGVGYRDLTLDLTLDPQR